jgi:multidrug efflux pump subunit AcrB
MIKSIIKFGLQKPILNYLLLFFIFILSIFSYFKIPKEIFPPVNLDSIMITGNYAGASSDILDKLAVNEIEDELKSLSEADKISTVVKTGFFYIKVDIKSGYKTSKVLDDIKDIVTKIKTNLPSDMNEPTVKEIVNSIPLITVAIFGDKSDEELLSIAKYIKSKINALQDLSNIDIWQDRDKQLLITFDDRKIEAYGLDKTLLINTLSSMSSIFPAGVIKDTNRHYYLSSQNGEKDLDKLYNTILRFSGKQFRLSDIATIEYVLSDTITTSHFNGKPDMSIGINKGTNGDAISLVKKIKEILKKEQPNYQGVSFDTYIDTSVWIKNRLNTVVSNIFFGVVLLSAALFFFINARIAFVVAIGIPTSFMIGLVSAEQLGYSLNMLSLLGALLALGMLVDEAIVVGENIYRHMEMGKDNMTAALDGAVEMFPAVLTATATTIFAFLPILLLSGEMGIFMKILPLMISVLLISSLVEAFFFLPLHAKHSYKLNKDSKRSEKIWHWNKTLYANILDFLLRWKYLSFGLLVGVIISGTIALLQIVKFEIFPEFDTTQIYISGSLKPGNALEQTEQKVTKMEQKLLKNYQLGDEIDSISSVIGMKLDGKQIAQNEEFYFHIFVNLKERAASNVFDKYINPILSPKYDDTEMTRIQSAKLIAQKMQKTLKYEIESKEFDELKIYVPGAGIVENDIEIAVEANHPKTDEAIKTIKDKLATIKGVSNIADDLVIGNKDLKFTINSYGQMLGFTEQNIVNQLRPFYFKASYSKMYDDSGLVDIVFVSKYKDSKNSLDSVELTIPNSIQKVFLNDVVTFQEYDAQSQIFKENGEAIISITATIDDTTSNEVFAILQPTLNDLKKDVKLEVKGEAKESQKMKVEMGQAFVIALILIFVALVWMFDSLVKSLIILSTVPLSILGVLIGHFIMGLNLTMPGLIGIVGLAGVIVNDGIIMMDFIKKAKNLDQLKSYAQLRLRPILLTSLTTILGLSTLIFFASGQALILQPMAVALGFGILWATILNLYYLPMLYRIIYLNKE